MALLLLLAATPLGFAHRSFLFQQPVTSTPKSTSRKRLLCNSDTAAKLKIPLPLGEQIFAGRPGMKEALLRREESFRKLAARLFNQFKPKLLTYSKLTEEQRKRVETIEVEVESEGTGLGRADENIIVIDEAYFRVGLARAYSDSLFVHTNAKELYDVWTDYLIDSIQQQDPTVYIDGLSCYLQFRADLYGPDLDLLVRKHMTAWFGYVIFHELSHILLNHDALLLEQYPDLIESYPKWPNGAFSLSRQNELDADRFALEIMEDLGPIDMSGALPGLAIWLLARHETLKKGNLLIPTHPEPKERVLALLDTILRLQKKDARSARQTKEITERFFNSMSKKIGQGLLRPVPPMRGERPAGLTLSLERFMLRDAQLMLDTQRVHKVKCLADLARK